MQPACSVCWRSGGVQRMPLLRGTHSHLCRLPTYQSTPSDGISSAMRAGRVRAVGQHRHAARAQAFGDRRERQHQRALAR